MGWKVLPWKGEDLGPGPSTATHELYNMEISCSHLPDLPLRVMTIKGDAVYSRAWKL